MAAHVAYDTDKRIIYVTTAPTNGVVTLDAAIDIYSDMKEDWRSDVNLGKLKFPLAGPVGGNAVTPTKSIGSYYFLKYGWYMRPYEADHTLYIENGFLLVQGGGDPWLPTIGGYTVNVRDSIPADAFVLTAAGNITEQDKLDIANRVWIYGSRGLTTFGTLLADIWSYATRLLTGSGLTAPEQAELTGIKERTDNLPDSPAAVSDIPTAEENALELLDNQSAP